MKYKILYIFQHKFVNPKEENIFFDKFQEFCEVIEMGMYNNKILEY